MHARFRTLALALFAVYGCAAPEQEPEPRTDPIVTPDVQTLVIDTPRTVRTRDGSYDVTWFPKDGVIPVNQYTTVDVDVRRTDATAAPVTGAEVAMSCYMPDHGHGMINDPKSVELGDGRYRIEGFMLHMGGYWTVSLTVSDQGLAATADDDITIE